MTDVPPVVRLFYVDDSGAEHTGWVVYAWIECTAAGWRDGLLDWLELRRALYADHQIPADYELHATKFVGGRGNPSLDPDWNRQKHLRSLVAEQALQTIGESRHVRVGSVFRRTNARGFQYAQEAADLYAMLIRHLDERLSRVGELGFVIVDGDGRDASYFAPHRALSLTRRQILEDPFFQDSHRSQWVQMADLVAYAVYQHLLRHPGKTFTWRWYETYLRTNDVNKGPLAL